jgi:hypothetical protein
MGSMSARRIGKEAGQVKNGLWLMRSRCPRVNEKGST